MSKSTRNQTNTGVSFLGLLSILTFIVFLTLKLCNVIDWSWWWITSPLWIYFALWLVFTTVVIIASIILYYKERDYL